VVIGPSGATEGLMALPCSTESALFKVLMMDDLLDAGVESSHCFLYLYTAAVVASQHPEQMTSS
jgi:hypothetical protein